MHGMSVLKDIQPQSKDGLNPDYALSRGSCDHDVIMSPPRLATRKRVLMLLR